MRLSYQYRLRPTAFQIKLFEHWLDMLRHQYNWLLAERFDWWQRNRTPINACPLVCHLPELKDKPDYYNQKRSLLTLKQERPWYKDIHSQVLQDVVQRVGLAFDRYLKGDASGRRSGKPRFKGQGRYRSFTYPQSANDWLTHNRVQLPKLGSVKVIVHRPLPEGFTVKTVCISKKVDVWYITFSLQDASVPRINPDVNPENTVGIDLGLKDFLVDSEGERVAIPQHYRKAQKRLAKAQRQLARKRNKASKRRARQVRKVAKVHAKVANGRKDFHHKIAQKYVHKYEVIAHEDLNIKGLARTRLAKSVHDAGWGSFLTILAHKAARAGGMTIAVNPSGTTQECSGCDGIVPKTLAERWHSCPHCGLELDRDENSARIVKQRAVGHPVQARRGDRNTGPMKREARPTARSA